MFKKKRDQLISMLSEKIMQRVRAEYTVMPRFGFHQPLDYHESTLPPIFGVPIIVQGEPLPVPAGEDRFGYSPEDTKEYLRWGKFDHDLVLRVVDKHYEKSVNLHIMDFGCSSGRVLRHFEAEHSSKDWTLNGVDVQARAIEWMRRNFPSHYQVVTTSVMPHLPFADNSLDVIYGFSVFTHIKYLWDAWLMELKRVLKPGGLLIQTVHAENAWNFYCKHRGESWVQRALPPQLINSESMDVDFFYYGDIGVSQVFWKRKIVNDFWGRYFQILEITNPPENSFQDWVICKKVNS
jgi:SAM-dependent methyltransferase